MLHDHDHERDDEQESSGRIRVSWQILAWVLGVIVTALMTYNSTANTMHARLAVLESKQQTTDQRFENIDRKLDRLIDMHMEPNVSQNQKRELTR